MDIKFTILLIWDWFLLQLNLNLHNFEDEVHNIVDKAVKEMAMERMLKELEIVWSTMEFQHEVSHGPTTTGLE